MLQDWICEPYQTYYADYVSINLGLTLIADPRLWGLVLKSLIWNDFPQKLYVVAPTSVKPMRILLSIPVGAEPYSKRKKQTKQGGGGDWKTSSVSK